MKKLLVLLLFAGAAWYGWTHYKDLFTKTPGHVAVIENQTGRVLQRVRLKVDGQTLVAESIPEDGTANLPFKVSHDSGFELTWDSGAEDRSWSGGMVPAGPMSQRHIFSINSDNEVTYRAESR